MLNEMLVIKIFLSCVFFLVIYYFNINRSHYNIFEYKNKMTFNNEFKYEQSTLSKFDIIGSYFVNLFYNEFYSKANTLKLNGSYDNLTDAYKSILGSYLDFIKKSEYFKQIIKGIHAYCISTTKYTTMSHKECIDFMVQEFIPQKLWNSIRENQKNKLFHESINNSINIFTTEIISNHLVMIIDNHSHHENIIILQDLFLKIILLEKDKIYSKFLNPNSNNTISIELFKTKLLELINEKKDLNLLNEKLHKNVNVLNQLAEKNNTIIIELQSKNKSYISAINELKKHIGELTLKNNDLQALLTKYKNATNNTTSPIMKEQVENTKKETTKDTKTDFKLKKNKTDIYSILLKDSSGSDNDNSNSSSDNDQHKYKIKNTKTKKEKRINNAIVKKDDNIEESNSNHELEFDNNNDYY